MRYPIKYLIGGNVDGFEVLQNEEEKHDKCVQRILEDLTPDEEIFALEKYSELHTGDPWNPDLPEDPLLFGKKIKRLQYCGDLKMVLGANVGEGKFNDYDLLVSSYADHELSWYNSNVPTQICADFNNPEIKLDKYFSNLQGKFKEISFDWSTTKFLFNYKIIESIIRSKCLMVGGSFYIDDFSTKIHMVLFKLPGNILNNGAKVVESTDIFTTLTNYNFNNEKYILTQDAITILSNQELDIDKKIIYPYYKFVDFTKSPPVESYRDDKWFAENLVLPHLTTLIASSDIERLHHIELIEGNDGYPISHQEGEIQRYFKITRER